MYVRSSPGRSGGSPGMAVAVMASTRVWERGREGGREGKGRWDGGREGGRERNAVTVKP